MCVQEQVARLVDAHDAKVTEMDREAGDRAREARQEKTELQAKVEALKEACEGG